VSTITNYRQYQIAAMTSTDFTGASVATDYYIDFSTGRLVSAGTGVDARYAAPNTASFVVPPQTCILDGYLANEVRVTIVGGGITDATGTIAIIGAEVINPDFATFPSCPVFGLQNSNTNIVSAAGTNAQVVVGEGIGSTPALIGGGVTGTTSTVSMQVRPGKTVVWLQFVTAAPTVVPALFVITEVFFTNSRS
jgi:hypothetical protein